MSLSYQLRVGWVTAIILSICTILFAMPTGAQAQAYPDCDLSQTSPIDKDCIPDTSLVTDTAGVATQLVTAYLRLVQDTVGDLEPADVLPLPTDLICDAPGGNQTSGACIPQDLIPGHSTITLNGLLLPAPADAETSVAPKSFPSFVGTAASQSEINAEVAAMNGQTLNDPVSGSSSASDPRFHVHPDANQGFPYRTIARIEYGGGNYGTGWMLGPDLVLTAGHVVYNRGQNRWANVQGVSIGANGNERPYGTCNVVNMYTVLGYSRDGSDNYDYGAIKVDCESGRTTGWMGLSTTEHENPNGQLVEISGFPNEKSGELWSDRDPIVRNNTYRLYSSTVATGGQSGAPMWQTREGCGTCSIGIFTHFRASGSERSIGPRIRSVMIDNYQAWRG